MKQILLLLTLIFCFEGFGQRLSLADLTNLCSKKNWEDVNQTLLSKSWTYYDSKKGSTYKYNTITWSFKKDYYSDKAQGWFYLFTYEGFPNKISYTVLNKDSYTLIQNSLTSNGFKLISSEIEDNEVISTYGNLYYTLEISTEKRKDDDWDDRSLTAYNITLIKKAGIYDPDNGKKTVYFEDATDAIQAEYTLLNGKLNGSFKSYYNNGQLKIVGYYVNGLKNGLFKEYDENGILNSEYTMTKDEFNGPIKIYYTDGILKKSGNYLNGLENGIFIEYDPYGAKEAEYVMTAGKKNGLVKVYEEAKLSHTTTFKNDFKNGQYTEYYYNDESGELYLKLIGEFLNEEKNGNWKMIYIEKEKERLLKYENYINGLKNGKFQEVNGDSLIIGHYKNDQLDGDYKVYLDLKRMIAGGVIETDVNKLLIESEGTYRAGSKSGYWKNYDLSGTLESEGGYSNGEKTGEWNYYIIKWLDESGKTMPYSGQLQRVQNYTNGKLNGKSTRYSYFDEEEYPCSEEDKKKNSEENCKKFVYKKFLETSYYKNDKLNGLFELKDSVNQVIARGNFKDDLKDGEWVHRYSIKDENAETNFIYQKGNYVNDKREGKWIQYYKENAITDTFNYKNGDLHGEYISWNMSNKPYEIKLFSFGKLKELTVYDSQKEKPIRKYEIYDENYQNFRCLKTDYSESLKVSQEYWVNEDEEIDHDIFDIYFTLLSGNSSSESKVYKDGEFKMFNSKDQPLITGKNLKEEQIGLWTYYYYDQNVKIESNYSQNKKIDEKYFDLQGALFSGEFIYIDQANNTREERKIKDGLRNGKTSYIDMKTNKNIKKENYKDGELK
jgi:antitoxin component YwqK of YwqJK toxin-antitoxin module